MFKLNTYHLWWLLLIGQHLEKRNGRLLIFKIRLAFVVLLFYHNERPSYEFLITPIMLQNNQVKAR